MKKNKEDRILKIDPSLPQLILPENKVGMFIEWYNKDIRFQNTIPHAFNEGYLKLHNTINVDISKYNVYFKELARQLKTTYREIENRFKNLLTQLESPTVYFKFIDRTIYISVYGADNELMSKISCEISENGENKEFDLETLWKGATWDDIQNNFNYYYLVIFNTCMWYIATTTKTTKYYYEETRPKYEPSKDKKIRHVSRTKTITTPIYDFTKIKKVKIESLITRRKGWTYSHSFEVHGHYRHYKNGKTIFISPYIKGKGKELQAQVITLDPEQI